MGLRYEDTDCVTANGGRKDASINDVTSLRAIASAGVREVCGCVFESCHQWSVVYTFVYCSKAMHGNIMSLREMNECITELTITLTEDLQDILPGKRPDSF